MTGLTAGATYHVRAYATNSAGTAYGSDIIFTTTCTYSISPASKSFSSSGGTGTVNVTTQDGCSWTAVTNESWITITSGSSGTGSGTVNYSVSANSSTSQKTGTMTIAGKTFTVTQDGIIPAEVHHFTFDIISTQTAGTAFNIKITARDSSEDENIVTTFNQDVNLTDTTGTINPGSVTFSSGTWTGDVIITKAQTNVTITATYNPKTGTSNSFDVTPVVPPTPIPTLSEWGMVIFSILLFASALWFIRKRKPQESSSCQIP